MSNGNQRNRGCTVKELGAGDELGCPDSNVHRPTGIASDVSTGPCISCLEEADCRLRAGHERRGHVFC